MNSCKLSEIVADHLEIGLANKQSLTVVGLEGNYLKSDGIVTISKALRCISSITLLNFHNNHLTEEAGEALASIILNNTKLEDLYLGNNKLQAGALKVLSALKHLSTLKVLDLNGNNITERASYSLAEVIGCNSSLSDLRLRNNKLKTKGFVVIAKSLSKLSTLESLNIRSNQITKEGVDDILSVLSSNKNMTHLYLGNNDLQDEAVKIKAALNDSKLELLDLDNNNISGTLANQMTTDFLYNCSGNIKTIWFRRNNLFLSGRLGVVSEQVCQISTFTSLDLSDNYLNDALADQLVYVIANNKSLEQLHLRNNNITSRGMIRVAQTLSTLAKFKSLNLGGNLISEDASDFIASIISNNTEINELYLGNNYLASGILKIAKALKTVPNFKVLHIDDNSINENVVEKFALDFLSTCNIEELNLSYNNLQLSSKYIFEALSKIRSLKSLSFTSCCMNDTVAEYLAVAIESNYSLQVLKLQNNYFNTKGIVTIAKSLSKLSALRSLNVRNNVLTSKEAVEAISLVLMNNRTLENFYFGENIIQGQAVKLMTNLKSISTLVTLYLINVRLTERDIDDLVTALENNILLEQICLAGDSLQSTGLNKILNTCKVSSKNLLSLDIQCNSVDPGTIAEISFNISSVGSLEAVHLGGITLTTVQKYFYEVFLYSMYLFEQLQLQVDECSSLERTIFGNKITQSKLLEVFSIQMQIHNSCLLSKWSYADTFIVALNYIDHVFTSAIDKHSLTLNMMNMKETNLKLSQINATDLFCFPLIKSLQVIDLELSNIDEEASFELAAMLRYNIVLKQLWLKGNKLNAAGALFILNSLEYISTLKVLDISYNNIGSQVANNLAAVISNNHTLEQLWLDGNNLTSKGVKRILPALICTKMLRILSLSNNKITDEAAGELATVVNSCTCLEDVILGNNEFQSSGICIIAHSFNKLLRLRKLDLFNNKITEDASSILADAISNCHSLQELYLSDNMLETTGTMKILHALKFKCKLQILTISNNNITEAVTNDLIDVLVSNKMFYVLLIGRNDLQNLAALKIAEAVKIYNTGMQILDMSDNHVSMQGKDEINKILSTVTQLKLFL